MRSVCTHRPARRCIWLHRSRRNIRHSNMRKESTISPGNNALWGNRCIGYSPKSTFSPLCMSGRRSTNGFLHTDWRHKVCIGSPVSRRNNTQENNECISEHRCLRNTCLSHTVWAHAIFWGIRDRRGTVVSSMRSDCTRRRARRCIWSRRSRRNIRQFRMG